MPSVVGLLEQRELTARRRVDDLREEADRLQAEPAVAEREWNEWVIAPLTRWRGTGPGQRHRRRPRRLRGSAGSRCATGAARTGGGGEAENSGAGVARGAGLVGAVDGLPAHPAGPQRP